MGAARLCLRARRLARRRLFARLHRSFLAARDQGFLRLHRMGRRAAVVERQGRPQRHFLLRHQPVARRIAAAAAPRRHVHLGRRCRLVPRHDASRRHSLDVLGELVRHAGQDRAIRRRRARQAQPRARRTGVRAGNFVGGGARAETAADFGAEIARASAGRRLPQGAFAEVGQGRRCRCSRPPTGAARDCTRAAISKASCAPPSKQKWLEAHGIEHWTHFYTDYGREQQLRFFDHFLHGKKQRLGEAAEGAAAGASSSTSSCRAPRTNGRSSARDGPSSISIRRR